MQKILGFLRKNKNLSNALIFQMAWWGILFAEYYKEPAALLFIFLFFLGLQLIAIQKNYSRNLVSWLFIGGLGTVMDYFCSLIGVFSLPDNGLHLWLYFIWVLFASTLNHSLSYFLHKKTYALIGGAFFGPLSYMAASQWGLIEYNHSPYFLTLHCLIWAFLFLSLLNLAQLCEKSRQ